MLMLVFAGLSLLLLGMLHALEPGHGKALVLATMLGEQRHQWRDVAGLALSVTLTHALSVFGLAVVLSLLVQGVLSATQSQAAQHLALVAMHLLSAGIIIILGLRLIRRAGRAGIANPAAEDACCDGPLHHHHHHEQPQALSHPSKAQHPPHTPPTRKPTPLWWLGVACGLTPCPVALATLLLALNASHWQHIGWMLAALLVFSAGLGLSVGMVGVVSTWLAKPLAQGYVPWFGKRLTLDPDRRSQWLMWLGRIAGVLVLLTGVMMAYTAFFHPAQLLPSEGALRMHWQQWSQQVPSLTTPL